MILYVASWPTPRVAAWSALLVARAIENQCYVVNCNGCGTAGQTRYGGTSTVWDPLGNALARAGSGEEILTADCDLSAVAAIRSAIPVFTDRRPDLY